MTAKWNGGRTVAALVGCGLLLAARAGSEPPDAGWPASREAILAAYERMPGAQLEELFLRCDARASHEMLDAGDGILCAMAWDTLLKGKFGGDVDAFLAWWRPRRQVPAQPSAVNRP
jgi:hypothetical protein